MSFSDADPLPGGELAAFTAVVESGSIQGAADALELTQSAATKRIQSLERRVGQPLLVRGRAGTTPTELGRTLYPLIKHALGALADVGEAARRAGAATDATLRLSASLTIGEFLLPGWLGVFRASAPGVHPQLEIVNSAVVTERVARREAEIGFVEGIEDLGRFEALTIARDELEVVVAAGHRWARRGGVSAGELLTEPYLTRERNSGTRAVADAALRRAGVQLSPALEAASLQSLKRAVRAGGFTIISALTLEAEERDGTLTGLRVEGIDMSRDLHAIRLSGNVHGANAMALWRWLQASIRL